MSDESHEAPLGAGPLLKTLIGLIVMFVIFYAVGLWAVHTA